MDFCFLHVFKASFHLALLAQATSCGQSVVVLIEKKRKERYIAPPGKWYNTYLSYHSYCCEAARTLGHIDLLI